MIIINKNYSIPKYKKLRCLFVKKNPFYQRFIFNQLGKGILRTIFTIVNFSKICVESWPHLCIGFKRTRVHHIRIIVLMEQSFYHLPFKEFLKKIVFKEE